MDPLDLSTASWTDAAAHDGGLAVLPVGSTEQHGPHLPLGTDALTARAVAEAGVEACSAGVCLAPTVPVGIAAEHRQFAGTLWVSPETFRAYVSEVIESLAYQGWEKVIVVNGHGGNLNALAELCGTLTRDERAYALPFTWFDAIEDRSEMGHGGPIETALLRGTHPELVREGRIEKARQGMAERWGEWVAGVNLAVDSAEFTDSGVVGDPGSEATNDGERGEALLAEAAAALAALLEAVAERETGRPARK
ncbi:creatininase [Halobacteriales archaeon QS_3_64_16]|nr:MAG: creatininase [Halobacteriales archaeon QS_3_64_16]